MQEFNKQFKRLNIKKSSYNRKQQFNKSLIRSVWKKTLQEFAFESKKELEDAKKGRRCRIKKIGTDRTGKKNSLDYLKSKSKAE